MSRADALRIGAHRVADEAIMRQKEKAARRLVLDRHEENSGGIREHSGLSLGIFHQAEKLRVYQVDRGQTWHKPFVTRPKNEARM